MTSRNRTRYVTLRNKDRLVRLAWHYMAKGRLYKEKIDQAYEVLTGEPAWQRELGIDVLGYDPRPRGVLPPDEDAWWRYVHDYYKHLAYDCYKIAQQLFLAMSWFAGPESQGMVDEIEELEVAYRYDPQCLLLREQAKARLRTILAQPACAIEETRACFAAMRRVREERTRQRRKRTTRCFTCSGGLGLHGQRCEEGTALLARAKETYQRANRLIGGPLADVQAAWASYEAARLERVEHDYGTGGP